MKVESEDEESSAESVKGKLDWTHVPSYVYDPEWFGSHSWDFSMTADVQVKQVYKFVKDQHLDEYKFHKDGVDLVGCKYWV